MLKSLWQWIKSTIEDRWLSRGIDIAKGDFLPTKMPKRNLLLLRDGKENWSVGFICPCGCNRTVELHLLPEAHPHWKLTINQKGLPTLSPSVWLKDGCRSHFWIRDGKIIWCN